MTTTTFDDARSIVKTQVTKVRWMLGLSGAVSIAFAAALIVWPDISLYALVFLVGALALARGVLGFVTAIGNPGIPSRGWMLVGSIAGIVVGVLVFSNTGISALALLYLIGGYAIVLGVAAIGSAFVLPLPGGDSALLGLTGVISILFGFVMFVEPGDGAIALIALIAAYSLIVGLTEVTVAIGGKRLLGLSDASATGAGTQVSR
jgi:uncharacterized membrane protein HdeD (DUF308 family)